MAPKGLDVAIQIWNGENSHFSIQTRNHSKSPFRIVREWTETQESQTAEIIAKRVGSVRKMLPCEVLNILKLL